MLRFIPLFWVDCLAPGNLDCFTPAKTIRQPNIKFNQLKFSDLNNKERIAWNLFNSNSATQGEKDLCVSKYIFNLAILLGNEDNSERMPIVSRLNYDSYRIYYRIAALKNWIKSRTHYPDAFTNVASTMLSGNGRHYWEDTCCFSH